MKLFTRTAQNCAFIFNAFIALFLAHMICGPIAVLWLHWVALISLPILIITICFFGLLAFQIGYHPLIALLWSVALFIPWASIVFILVLFFQAKAFLKSQNYEIVLWGARPVPHVDVISEMDELIKAGKIKVPDQSGS